MTARMLKRYAHTSTAIRVRNAGRIYQTGGPQENYYALRDAIVNISKGAVQAMHPGSSG